METLTGDQIRDLMAGKPITLDSGDEPPPTRGSAVPVTKPRPQRRRCRDGAQPTGLMGVGENKKAGNARLFSDLFLKWPDALRDRSAFGQLFPQRFLFESLHRVSSRCFASRPTLTQAPSPHNSARAGRHRQKWFRR